MPATFSSYVEFDDAVSRYRLYVDHECATYQHEETFLYLEDAHSFLEDLDVKIEDLHDNDDWEWVDNAEEV